MHATYSERVHVSHGNLHQALLALVGPRRVVDPLVAAADARVGPLARTRNDVRAFVTLTVADVVEPLATVVDWAGGGP